MDNEKLKISLGEVYSDTVDEKLKSQDAFSRTQEHYAQRMQAPAATGGGRGSLLYNAIVYMTVFGFLGGLAGWAGSEMIEQSIHNPKEEFLEFLSAVGQIEKAAATGEINEEEAEQAFEAGQAGIRTQSLRGYPGGRQPLRGAERSQIDAHVPARRLDPVREIDGLDGHHRNHHRLLPLRRGAGGHQKLASHDPQR